MSSLQAMEFRFRGNIGGNAVERRRREEMEVPEEVNTYYNGGKEAQA